jgi:hypothetical protein
MSKEECPRCHTVRQDKPREGVGYARRYACGTTVNDDNEVLQQGRLCFEKEYKSRLAFAEQACEVFVDQLVQRNERIRELEAEVERLTEENAHMRTMLKAASAIALMDDD